MKIRAYRIGFYLVLLFVVHSVAFVSVLAQGSKPILVIFHGAKESKDDVRELAQASHESKLYQRVVVIGFNWANHRIPEAAPRIFTSLKTKFPDSEFVLLGNKEGGLIAEWIATKVKAAEGKILRVITLNTPFEEKEGADSRLLSELKTPPLNNQASTEFLRLWEKDNQEVPQESALKVLSGDVPTSRFIIRTKPYDPHEALPELLSQAKKEYENKDFSKVTEICDNILAIQSDHPEANLLMGYSYYALGLGNENAESAAKMYSKSYQYLAQALASGQEVSLPVTHHHAEFLDQNVCSGYITLTSNSFTFHSPTMSGHDVTVPISRLTELYLEPAKAARLHTAFMIQNGKKEYKKSYNFHSAELKLSREIAWLTPRAPLAYNAMRCDVACLPSIQVIHDLLRNLTSQPAIAAEKHLVAADVLVKKRLWPEAENECRQAIQLIPNTAWSHRCLGTVLIQQRKWDEALVVYQKALQLEPRNALIHADFGMILSAQQKWEEAEAAYREALRLEPNNPLTLNNLGYHLIERNKNLSEALQMIQQAVKMEPTNAFYLDSLGWAYFKMDKLEEAERYLIEAIRYQKKSATMHEHLGDLYIRRGKRKAAREAWQKALSLPEEETNQTNRLREKIAGITKN